VSRGESGCADWFEEDLRLGDITFDLRDERREMDAAKCPVADEQATEVALRKVSLAIAENARRGTAPHVRERGHGLRHVVGDSEAPLKTRQPPAVMPPRLDVVEPARRIPRKEIVALAVAVVG